MLQPVKATLKPYSIIKSINIIVVLNICNRIRSQLQCAEYMLLIIVVLLTETADIT
jgi:hypothetical protein